MSAAMPADSAEWNAAVRHSLDNPTHVLVPYLDVDRSAHVQCHGSGDPDAPSNCDYGTEEPQP